MPQSYRVHLYRTVVAKDAEATFCKTISLPFVPFRGLSLSLDMADNEAFEDDIFEIEQLSYDCNGEAFLADETITYESCPCKPEDECCIMRPEEYIAMGWELSGEVRRGEKRAHCFPWLFNPEDTGPASYERLFEAAGLKRARQNTNEEE